MRHVPLVLWLALGLAATAAADAPAVNDPEVRRGIALVDEGEYDSAILALDTAVRRLGAAGAHSSSDLAEAYFYLGVAYLGKGHETSAKARFREAVRQARDMSPSPEKFPPRVIELFEKAREESKAETASTAAVPAAAPAKKKGGSKTLLVVGGLALAGGGAAAALGGGGGSDGSSNPPGQSRTETSQVHDNEQQFFTFTASRAGTLEVTLTWQDRNVGLTVDCAEMNPPYTQCTGSFNRTSDTSARFTSPVSQKEYLVAVSNYSGRGGVEPFTITLRYP